MTHKNPSAVALGRLGGLKGGKARADKLTSKQRSAISRMGGLKAKANRAAKLLAAMREVV